MVTLVKKVDVPTFLREGERFKLLTSEDDVVEVPEGCFTKGLLMTQPADLNVVLKTLEFWVVRALPVEVREFAMYEMEERDLPELGEAETDPGGEHGILEFVRQLVLQKSSVRALPLSMLAAFKASADTAVARAAQYCWYGERNVEKGATPMIFACVAQRDDLEALKVLVDLGFPTEHVPLLCFDHLECVLYLREKGVACDPDLCRMATKQKRLAVLQALHENDFPWDVSTCGAAAEVDALDCLAYAHEHGCPWDAVVSAAAAGKGSLACLTYLHEHGCPWDAMAMFAAASAGELECLQYLHERGCPWGPETMSGAASGGHAACLRYLLRAGCPRPANLCLTAAGSKNVATLRCAREFHCPWDASVASAAVSSGHLPMVKYVIQQGCPIHHGTLYVPAIDKDNVPLLEFLHELGVPWTAAQSDLAILLGKPASLAALHDGGCPLSKDALYLAATCNSFDCFKFLHEHGCVWNTETYKAAERAADRRIIRYALERKCPRPGGGEEWFVITVGLLFTFCVALLLLNFGA